MSSRHAAEDDDPVVASYDIFLTQSLPVHSQTPSDTDPSSSRVFLLQYPAHRPSSKPYSNARLQKPTGLRLKPEVGLLEVDVPILTNEYYNDDTGYKYGKALAESRTIQAGGTHGLGGGFSTGSAMSASLRDIPAHEEHDQQHTYLNIQTLGGKIAVASERDPVYLLGSFRDNELHLSHLDAVVQMRPQLHHIDAEEENNQKKFQAASSMAASKAKAGADSGAPKLESKAIEIKIKDTKDDNKDRNLNENSKLLRDIQMDQWHPHEWIDQDDATSQAMREKHLYLGTSLLNESKFGDHEAARLKSCIGNGDWLDKMSAPREDGKKGLLAKLRGRERERARRKKAEEEKRLKQKQGAGEVVNTTELAHDVSSESELSSAEDTGSETGDATDGLTAPNDQDTEMVDTTGIDDVDLKEEPAAPVTSDIPITQIPSNQSEESNTVELTPKRRGRPKKNQATG